jgi:putative transposase
MRKQPLLTGEYYHIYNRGVDKRDIFSDKEDIKRFIESIKEFNQIEVIGSLRNLRKDKNTKTVPKALSGEPLVLIIGYCLNPNHFHFILKQSVDGGIAKFMKTVL